MHSTHKIKCIVYNSNLFFFIFQIVSDIIASHTSDIDLDLCHLEMCYYTNYKTETLKCIKLICQSDYPIIWRYHKILKYGKSTNTLFLALIHLLIFFLLYTNLKKYYYAWYNILEIIYKSNKDINFVYVVYKLLSKMIYFRDIPMQFDKYDRLKRWIELKLCWIENEVCI